MRVLPTAALLLFVAPLAGAKRTDGVHRTPPRPTVGKAARGDK